MKKNAQGTGSGAATLILIILLLIIFYILFLPPDTRDELLGDGTGTTTDSGDSGSDDDDLPHNVLLEKKDLSMTQYRTLQDKELPDVYLFEIVNAKELAHFNPFVIKYGWFDKDFKNFTFPIEDLDKTEDVLLSFMIKEAKGTLMVRLNGFVIYDYPASTGNIEPIKIDKAYLRDINRIEFIVDGVGMKFWKTNEFSIEKAKITADITDISKQKSRNVFTLSETEYENIESAKLTIFPECKAGAVGQLDILLNNREIFSGMPTCNDIEHIPLPVGMLEEDDNFIVFTTTMGTYTIRNVKVAMDYKDAEKWKFSFYINDDEWKNIEDGSKDVDIKIRFEDDEDNRANFKINGHYDDFDEDDNYFESDITRYVDEGSNTLTIEPKTDFDIDYIRIELV